VFHSQLIGHDSLAQRLVWIASPVHSLPPLISLLCTNLKQKTKILTTTKPINVEVY
jgi:hypothetical protein